MISARCRIMALGRSPISPRSRRCRRRAANGMFMRSRLRTRCEPWYSTQPKPPMFTTVSSRKVQFRSSLAMVTKEFLAARSNGAKCRSGLYNSQQPTQLVSLFAIVDAHDDNRIGDEPAVVALLIQHLQSALDYVDVPTAMRQSVEHRLLIHRFGLGHADGHVHSHIVGCLADQSRKSQAAVMNRIEHRPLRG